MPLTIVSPAPASLALAFGGAVARKRRAMLWQARHYESIGFLDAGEPVALAMIDRHAHPRRAELAIAFAPAAENHMRALIRAAQLTLVQLADNRILTWTRIRPDNRAGTRMAQLTGFQPGRFRDPTIWIFKG